MDEIYNRVKPMDIEYLKKANRPEWDEFCFQSDYAWFWHTSNWIEYCVHYKPHLKTESQSFFLKRNREIIAVVPLFVENHEIENKTYKVFRMAEGPILFPALKSNISEKEREKILGYIFAIFDEIAREEDVAYSLVYLTPLIPISLRGEFPTFNILMKYGFNDCSLNTRIIDLRKNNLWNDMRKGNRWNVKKAKRELTFEVFDKDKITKEIYEKYRKLHHKAAGRITRPLVTFEMWYEWIKQGHGFLSAARRKDEYVGFGYMFYYKNACYYGSSANDPEHADVPISSLLLWETMMWLKRKGCEFFEVGLQQFGDLLYDMPSEKEKNITFFKSGFGGKVYPMFRGEKFWNREYFLRIMKSRVNEFAKRIIR